MNLTPAFVASVTVKVRTDYPDATVPGLVLRVTPTGVKTWSLRYRTTSGHAKRYTLGSAKSLTLSKARHKARQTLNKVAAGQDPAAEKKRATSARTFSALAEDYLDKHAKVHKRSWRLDDGMLKSHVLPAWKDRSAKDIARRDVRQLIESVAQRAPVSANRVLALVRKIYNFGIRRDWVEVNPATLIELPTKEVSRERVLTDDEIRTVWELCDREPLALATYYRLRLVTAQRGGELARLKWSDVGEDQFGAFVTIPADVAKNGRAHRVPLSPMAKALLMAIPKAHDNPWVFQGRGTGRLAMATLTDAGTRLNDRLTTLRGSDANFRGHDLRRTAATKMAEAGIPQMDIARVLNHVEAGPRATQVYQRYEWDKEKRIALETWARVLTGILEEQDTKAALPFVRR